MNASPLHELYDLTQDLLLWLNGKEHGDRGDFAQAVLRATARVTSGAAPPTEAAIAQRATDGEGTPDRLDRDARLHALEALAAKIRDCRLCPLSLGRTNAVPGYGPLDPLVLVVGEGPGANEDAEGEPFVGAAGQYLDKWLAAIGLSRETNAFIANIVKCRPPGNRDPKPDEITTCAPYLQQQIELIRPRLILTVGRVATRVLTGVTTGITRIHGTFYEYEGYPVVATFHPSAVLRNPGWRAPVWQDLQAVRDWLIAEAGHQIR